MRKGTERVGGEGREGLRGRREREGREGEVQRERERGREEFNPEKMEGRMRIKCSERTE